MGDPIRILLVDDHALFREGLARLLHSEPGFSVDGHCASIDDALVVLSRISVDIILLDYDLGNEVGTNIFASVAVLKPAPRVLLVTAGMTEKDTCDALTAGAMGVVLKHSGPKYLIEAIRRAVGKDAQEDTESWIRVLSSRIDEARIVSFQERPLTRRQSKALHGILDGLGNREIAEKMNVSESSVKAIVQELFDKAGVRTRSQLVRVTIEKHSGDWLRDNDFDQGGDGVR